ncbi:phosphotransferase family enzyme [Hydrogenispora ethanolica]|uniref:Phosphotransferase family enzyme n=1 Tax=Hydrogenispora ethanolica TaxID=1082276 RepID=A0A4V6NH72_HYDET|nr:aminoglycoside phosphotransferase family protein [Hydrogenispora ethanolica]TCL76857.1 phosphotransferase family enzyme [Hydrogenispora ethanolica]
MAHDLEPIVRQFQFGGAARRIEPHGCGHINDTYAVAIGPEDGPARRYILQRLNHQVFHQPEQVMANIEAVTRHLRRKIAAAGGDPDRETLNLVPAVDGRSFYRDGDGNYWRVYAFIGGARTYQVVESPEHLYHAGRAFGKFLRMLEDFPAARLHETIPDFHHTRQRFERFQQALARDSAGRARAVGAEIDFVLSRAADTAVLVELIAAGRLPLRVTHNDTKFNNVLIDDATGAGLCVLDLDTVMPGLSLYDFGDAIRSGATRAAEDEPDLAKVSLDMALFEQFSRGYLAEAGPVLTPLELEYLPFGAKLMTLECGIRFLTDHLEGDVYFKIHRPGHNLDRARTQFKLVAELEKHWDRMARLTGEYR